MSIRIVMAGESRSFPGRGSELSAATGTGIVIAGTDAGSAYASLSERAQAAFVAVELGTECLAEHVGLNPHDAHTKTVGFARFCLGRGEPSRLIELVRMPWTDVAAVDAARSAFEACGWVVAVCGDYPGRIVDRLIRPYFNAALRRLDEGLASADDLDTTLRLGLGYPEGPIALLERTGLDHHFDVSNALHAALGGDDHLPARRARVAKARALRD
ncbi:3-hydroxyacyl-CoA dehydrogenase family protein [Steroidobacter flavus]|uniref:3-hydroxyacyl-CoA dehydrogenase family protein n=1 Tax=Steroidobacter flavus TaxID=1842136 RepID=A0ABV8SYY5_9GAMM